MCSLGHRNCSIVTEMNPLLSFGVLFINGIVFGLFVWRSRSLASSMAAHGFANGSVLVQYWVYSFLFQ